MLNTSERASPCSARCSPRSVGRLTSIWSSSCSTVMSRGMRSVSSPLGPLTRTRSVSMDTVTPAGTGMGCLPMRLIAARSPHLGHRARRPRRRWRASWPVITPWEVEMIVVPMPPCTLGMWRGVHVHPPARPRDPAQARRSPACGPRCSAGRSRRRSPARPRLGALGVEAVDVALLGQDARQLARQARGGGQTVSWEAAIPLRMRVRKSAVGSVIDMRLTSCSWSLRG